MPLQLITAPCMKIHSTYYITIPSGLPKIHMPFLVPTANAFTLVYRELFPPFAWTPGKPVGAVCEEFFFFPPSLTTSLWCKDKTMEKKNSFIQMLITAPCMKIHSTYITIPSGLPEIHTLFSLFPQHIPLHLSTLNCFRHSPEPRVSLCRSLIVIDNITVLWWVVSLPLSCRHQTVR